MMLSMFDGVTEVVWHGDRDPETAERKAKASLADTGNPQGVHMHGPGDVCVRGDGGCYVLRVRP